MEPGVALDDPHRSLLTQDMLFQRNLPNLHLHPQLQTARAAPLCSVRVTCAMGCQHSLAPC